MDSKAKEKRKKGFFVPIKTEKVFFVGHIAAIIIFVLFFFVFAIATMCWKGTQQCIRMWAREVCDDNATGEKERRKEKVGEGGIVARGVNESAFLLNKEIWLKRVVLVVWEFLRIFWPFSIYLLFCLAF